MPFSAKALTSRSVVSCARVAVGTKSAVASASAGSRRGRRRFMAALLASCRTSARRDPDSARAAAPRAGGLSGAAAPALRADEGDEHHRAEVALGEAAFAIADDAHEPLRAVLF